jgi:DNA helicase HerA-like ATPase
MPLRRVGIALKTNEGLPYINDKDRFRHCYVLGATRSGKTNFFLSFAKQETDHAMIVLDPAGTFAPKVASAAPIDRLIYVDKNHPIGLNPLRISARDYSTRATELSEVVNSSVESFSPQQREISVQMHEIIGEAVKYFEEKHLTLEYMADFLNLRAIRRSHFKGSLPIYWSEFDQVYNREKRQSATRVAARLNLLAKDTSLAPFLEGNDFDIPKIAEERKIVCFNLHGYHSTVQRFLGNLITHRLKSYYELGEAKLDSPPVFFYCDEFHLFLSPFFSRMLAECGKFNISVNLSQQTQSQVNKEVLDIALSNCWMKVVMTCSAYEAERMAKEMGVTFDDIFNLGKYEAYVSVGRSRHKVKTIYTDLPDYTPKNWYFLRDEFIEF